MLGVIWAVMIITAILFSCATGTTADVGNAVIAGAQDAVTLCISTGGLICLWCAVMELMRRCGIAAALAKALRPLLKLLFPISSRHEDILEPLSANVSANFLGLGNAATPMGIKAAKKMARLSDKGIASDELCRFVVLNTASIQLLPTNIAAIRAAEGAEMPFDILPAVWISSGFSVAVGLAAAYLMARAAK